MKRLACGLILLAALCWPVSLYAQSQQFVVFVHAGPNRAADPKVKLIAAAVAQGGYLVRAPDNDVDPVAPGVDYFADSAETAAKDVARIVNNAFKGVPGSSVLTVRRQRVRNPAGYIGVWLFRPGS
jgi:hypothetical protein